MTSNCNTEIDLTLKKAVRLLHSSNPNSATELRLLLDELIIQRHGSEKTLTNTLSKQFLEEEANFPGMIPTPPLPALQPEQLDAVIHLTESPDTEAMGDIVAEDETNLKDFGDLNCCVCAEMMITASNRLIECSNCSALYHQECHKPAITDEAVSEDQVYTWQCDGCTNKPATSKAAVIVQSDEPVLLQTNSKTTDGLLRLPSPVLKQDSDVAAVATSSTTQASGISSSCSNKHHHRHHHKSSKSSSKHQDRKRKSHK